jgi:hypothetical protein
VLWIVFTNKYKYGGRTVSVNPKNQRKIVVVHGVQLGADEDQEQHKAISNLVKSRLGHIPLDFAAEMFLYEDINDEAQRLFSGVSSAIADTAVGGFIAGNIIDLIGDVVISLLDSSTAHQIRKALKAQILEHYEKGNPCYLVAHSLGSIYAFDVLNELIRDDKYFDRNSRKTWPIQGILTIGSPIGVDIFNRSRKHVAYLGEGDKWLRWYNYWDRTDPVVSGNIFGKQTVNYDIAELYQTADKQQGWVIRDKIIDTGKVWLMSHVAYWDNPVVGDTLVEMITN